MENRSTAPRVLFFTKSSVPKNCLLPFGPRVHLFAPLVPPGAGFYKIGISRFYKKISISVLSVPLW